MIGGSPRAPAEPPAATMADVPDTTELLSRATRGDEKAAQALFPIVYEELRNLAGAYMARQGDGHTLQPTALVNEAYLKLVDVDTDRIRDRTHFFRLAARAMRSILVDHARGRQRAKRGGGRLRVTLDDALVSAGGGADVPDLIDLDASLDRLAGVDEQLARIVEYRFFGGLANAEIAEVLEVSTRTVERGWRVARAWLLNDMSAPGEGAGGAGDGSDGGGAA